MLASNAQMTFQDQFLIVACAVILLVLSLWFFLFSLLHNARGYRRSSSYPMMLCTTLPLLSIMAAQSGFSSTYVPLSKSMRLDILHIFAGI